MGSDLETTHCSASAVLERIWNECQDRLRHFNDIPLRHILYGGDFGGDLAIALMDSVYGETGYKIYGTILPCYPTELKDYIYHRLHNRPNATIFDCGPICYPRLEGNIVTHGACSAMGDVLPKEEECVEVCGCFHIPGALDRFLIRQGARSQLPWLSVRTFPDGRRKHYVYLFEGYNPRVCEMLALHTDRAAEYWDWWRLHVCESSIHADEPMQLARALWKEIGPEGMIANILSIRRYFDGRRPEDMA